MYRTRPRALDLYGMYYEGKGSKGAPLTTKGGHLDMSSLSSSYGPRTTETLIEAIFNPVPSNVDRPSPFTYYVPWEQQVTMKPGLRSNTGSMNGHGGNDSPRSVATSSEHASIHSNSPSGKAPSLSSQSGHSYMSHTHSNESGMGLDEDKRKWWRKIGSSRPGTPAI